LNDDQADEAERDSFFIGIDACISVLGFYYPPSCVSELGCVRRRGWARVQSDVGRLKEVVLCCSKDVNVNAAVDGDEGKGESNLRLLPNSVPKSICDTADSNPAIEVLSVHNLASRESAMAEY
ncbi:hypothetical protein GYMLUDRAFT_50213, partial [Collybiopsis luxurians FD-317 M1]